jgi:hypothetical protein
LLPFGCVAVVKRIAEEYLKKRGDWFQGRFATQRDGAAFRQAPSPQKTHSAGSDNLWPAINNVNRLKLIHGEPAA